MIRAEWTGNELNYLQDTCPSPTHPSEMAFTTHLTKYYVITIFAIVIIAALVIPYPTEVVPKWKLVMIDENFLPAGNRLVAQEIDGSYYNHKTKREAMTDKNGFVTFSPDYLWAGVAQRFAGAISGALGSDVGFTATVSAPGCEGTATWKKADEALPERLVCR